VVVKLSQFFCKRHVAETGRDNEKFELSNAAQDHCWHLALKSPKSRILYELEELGFFTKSLVLGDRIIVIEVFVYCAHYVNEHGRITKVIN
jgi:hypothetical protein